MTLAIDVTVDKYRYTMTEAGTVHVFRNGEHWDRDVQGDGLLMAFAAEIAELRAGPLQSVSLDDAFEQAAMVAAAHRGSIRGTDEGAKAALAMALGIMDGIRALKSTIDKNLQATIEARDEAILDAAGVTRAQAVLERAANGQFGDTDSLTMVVLREYFNGRAVIPDDDEAINRAARSLSAVPQIFFFQDARDICRDLIEAYHAAPSGEMFRVPQNPATLLQVAAVISGRDIRPQDTMITLSGKGRTLLTITAAGEVTGKLEDMGEAARVFVEQVRTQFKGNGKAVAAAIIGELKRYDLNHDGYRSQDVNGEYVEAEDAIEAIERAADRSVPSVGPLKLDTDRQVFFYEQEFYVLSNFSAFHLWWRGHRYDTSEAAYHCEKFELGVEGNGLIRSAIRNAPSAHEAYKIAALSASAVRADWKDIRVDTMRQILRAKAEQHEYVRRKLLETGNRELVENSWRDDFWGWGENRAGRNMLGKLWMEVRAELRGDRDDHRRG
jgi:ribA/ribD-fused uncharacterized protein